MKDLRSILKESDPLRHEPPLSEGDAARMRRAVVNAAGKEHPAPLWRGALAFAAIVLLLVAVGRLAGPFDSRGGNRSLRTAPAPRSAERTAPHTAPAVAGQVERRQVQFATPGGTRIIWTLDPEFKIQEVVP
jgi:hypothetical protein